MWGSFQFSTEEWLAWFSLLELARVWSLPWARFCALTLLEMFGSKGNPLQFVSAGQDYSPLLATWSTFLLAERTTKEKHVFVHTDETPVKRTNFEHGENKIVPQMTVFLISCVLVASTHEKPGKMRLILSLSKVNSGRIWHRNGKEEFKEQLHALRGLAAWSMQWLFHGTNNNRPTVQALSFLALEYQVCESDIPRTKRTFGGQVMFLVLTQRIVRFYQYVWVVFLINRLRQSFLLKSQPDNSGHLANWAKETQQNNLFVLNSIKKWVSFVLKAHHALNKCWKGNFRKRNKNSPRSPNEAPQSKETRRKVNSELILRTAYPLFFADFLNQWIPKQLLVFSIVCHTEVSLGKGGSWSWPYCSFLAQKLFSKQGKQLSRIVGHDSWGRPVYSWLRLLLRGLV